MVSLVPLKSLSLVINIPVCCLYIRGDVRWRRCVLYQANSFKQILAFSVSSFVNLDDTRNVLEAHVAIL